MKVNTEYSTSNENFNCPLCSQSTFNTLVNLFLFFEI